MKVELALLPVYVASLFNKYFNCLLVNLAPYLAPTSMIHTVSCKFCIFGYRGDQLQGVKFLKDTWEYRLRSPWMSWCVFCPIALYSLAHRLSSCAIQVFTYFHSLHAAEILHLIGAKFNCCILLVHHLKRSVWILVKSLGNFPSETGWMIHLFSKPP